MFAIIIADLISELVAQGINKVESHMNRSEIVLQILNKFNLKPDDTPNDFEGVYKYTLVEYGVGKPQPILNLFRQQEIQEAFKKAFQENRVLDFHCEVENCIVSYSWGDEIRENNIDYKSEIGEFEILFTKVAKRAIPVSETFIHKKLDELAKIIKQSVEPLVDSELRIFEKGLDGIKKLIVKTNSRFIKIGRSPYSDITLPELTVSWEHGYIVFTQGKYIYRHLSQKNSTYIDRKHLINELNTKKYLLELPLADNDKIRIGGHELIVSFDIKGCPIHTTTETEE